MLSDAHRLRKQKDIERVLSTGRGVFFAGLRLKASANGGTTTRFCFVVSSAVAKKAHDRNRFKRRLREAARLSIGAVAVGYDIVVWLQRQPADKSGLSLAGAFKTV
jgi:ribonuclease P protein component